MLTFLKINNLVEFLLGLIVFDAKHLTQSNVEVNSTNTWIVEI